MEAITAKPKKIYYHLIAIFALVPIALAYAALPVLQLQPLDYYAATIALGIVSLLVLSWWALAVLRSNATTYTVTESYVAEARGIINRETKKVPLIKLEDYTIRRGIWNVLLGTASVEFDTAGELGYEISMRSIGLSDAENIVDFLDRIVKKEQRAAEWPARRRASV
ncbi:MAG: PH domain-containing protein [Candidatus Micrarchaeota archaeon]